MQNNNDFTNTIKYDSLANLLVDAIIEKRSDPAEEELLAYKRKSALAKHRVYHLLLKYQNWWQADKIDLVAAQILEKYKDAFLELAK